MEARALISRVELIENEVEPFHSFVGVLGGVVNPVIVVPQRAQRLIDVPVWLVARGKPRLLHGVVMVEILSTEEPSAGTSVALRSRVKIMQVGANLGDSKPAILALDGQLVEPANHHG